MSIEAVEALDRLTQIALDNTSEDVHDAVYEDAKRVRAEWQASRKVEAAPSDIECKALQDRIADTLAYYECRRTNPKADHPRMGYHAFSEDQREHLRERQAETAAEVVRIILSRSQPVQVEVTDEMVEKAARVIYDEATTLQVNAWDNEEPGEKAFWLNHARAALEAALGGGDHA